MCSFFGVCSTIGIFILMGIYYFRRQRGRMVHLIQKFEGPTTLPVFGNMGLMHVTSPTKAYELFQRENKKYTGRPYRLWIFFIPVVVIHHYSDVPTFSKCTTKDTTYSLFKLLVGDGLITSNGDHWRRSRGLIEPAFNTHMLSAHIFFILVKHANNLVAELGQQGKQELDIWKYVYKAAFNSIHDITMGFDEKLDEEKVNKFEQNRCFELLIRRVYCPWLSPEIIFKIFTFFVTGDTNPYSKLRSLFDESIERCKRKYMDRKSYWKTDNEKKKIIMDTLLDGGCSDKDIKDHIVTLFCAGTETNAVNVCYTLLMLAMNQNIQKIVHDELVSVFGDSNKPPNHSDLSKLTFLEQCIKESLRTTPPAILLRKVQHDVALSDGRIVPSGTVLVLSLFDIHHNPEIYPDPYTWNPHNFDPEKVAMRPAHAFIPFATGPRMCIGYRYAMMAMKIVLSTVLRHYELKTSCTQATLDFTVIVRVKEGFNVQFHPRIKNTGLK